MTDPGPSWVRQIRRWRMSRSERIEGRGRGRDLQRHVQLDAEYELVSGTVVAAGVDDVLQIGLNVKAVIEIEGIENFSDVLIALHRETRLWIGSDESALGVLDQKFAADPSSRLQAWRRLIERAGDIDKLRLLAREWELQLLRRRKRTEALCPITRARQTLKGASCSRPTILLVLTLEKLTDFIAAMTFFYFCARCRV